MTGPRPDPAEHVEREVKLEAELDAVLPDLAGVATTGERRVHDLAATYLDTPGLALQRARTTLRRRTGGDDAGWHLKLPREDGARTERHAPLGRTAARVPPELRELVTAVVGAAPLLPVATLLTRRAETDLLDDSGRVVAVLCDDVVLTAPAGEGWRELEVELAPGADPAVLERAVAALVGDARTGISRSGRASKVARALGPLPDPPPPRSPVSSAAEVLLDYLRVQVGVVQAREGGVRTHDPDAVHKTRVALRRLRSTLRVYRRLLDREVTDPLREEMRWYAGVLGEVRDIDVVRQHLRAMTTALPGPRPEAVRARIESTLDEAHESATEQLDEALDSERLDRLAEQLADLAAAPPWRGRARRRARAVLPRLAGQAVRRAERTAAEAAAATDADDQQRLVHETRKRAKAARYAHEALVPAWGGPADAAAAGWERVTELLGSTQDGVTAASWLARTRSAAAADGEEVAPFDVLAERVAREAAAAQDAGGDALDGARSVPRLR
ncbi:CYTH and CHAD domain-containing protein [Janibacter terrae]|uniref:CYTH and CHAD domain-containing protein n=1 Tax=Janibacter terrae TaxID=103817 RepID=UPI0037F234A4